MQNCETAIASTSASISATMSATMSASTSAPAGTPICKLNTIESATVTNQLESIIEKLSVLPLNNFKKFQLLKQTLGNDVACTYSAHTNNQLTHGVDVARMDFKTKMENNIPGIISLTVKNPSIHKYTKATPVNKINTTPSGFIKKQCNGVVISFPEWRIVAAHTNLMNSMVAPMYVDESYTCYEILDGTLVTLYKITNDANDDAALHDHGHDYSHSNQWRLMTARGNDVTDLKWLGDLTFMQVFKYMLAKIYPNFKFNDFKDDYYYTFGFRYHEYHPLVCLESGDAGIASDNADASNNATASTSEDMWLVKHACNSRNVHGNCNGDAIDHEHVKMFKTQPVSKLGMHSINEQVKKNDNALDVFLKTRQVHYGYIYRTNSNTREDIVMESTLLKALRGLFYNFKWHDNSQKVYAATIAAYFSENRELYLELFPQFAHIYKNIEALVQALEKKFTTYAESVAACGVPSADAILGFDTNLDHVFMGVLNIEHHARMMLRSRATPTMPLAPPLLHSSVDVSSAEYIVDRIIPMLSTIRYIEPYTMYVCACDE